MQNFCFCQLSMQILWCRRCSCVVDLKLPNREFKQPRRRRQQKPQNPTNLHIWQWKTVFLHALHVHISSFDILQTFSFFLRREMTSFAVVWTTWAYDDKIMFSFVLLCPKRWFQFNSRVVRTRFSSMMTLNNCKSIAERRSCIFRWRSRFRRRRVCLSSLISFPDQ